INAGYICYSLRHRYTITICCKCYIILYAQATENFLVLSNVAQALLRQFHRAYSQSFLTLIKDRPLPGFQKSHNSFQQGGLPCSVAANNKNYLPLVQMHRDVMEHPGAAIGDIDFIYLE